MVGFCQGFIEIIASPLFSICNPYLLKQGKWFIFDHIVFLRHCCPSVEASNNANIFDFKIKTRINSHSDFNRVRYQPMDPRLDSVRAEKCSQHFSLTIQTCKNSYRIPTEFHAIPLPPAPFPFFMVYKFSTLSQQKIATSGKQR